MCGVKVEHFEEIDLDEQYHIDEIKEKKL